MDSIATLKEIRRRINESPEETKRWKNDSAKAIDDAITSLERRKPRKPVVKGLGIYSLILCPRCGNDLSEAHIGIKYCTDENCHQALDWSSFAY